MNSEKKYEALKIPDRQQKREDGDGQSLPAEKEPSQNQGQFYEIEYDSCAIPGVGKFVRKPQKIEEPEKDEIRDLFHQMRDIARENRAVFFYSSRFYDQKVQQETAKIFYKQGMFMKDFSDEYSNQIPYSAYFPYYQMMGYEQLRTYFTWRTEVRRGTVAQTSLSYAFLYIYELINNIGVENPQAGFDQLLFFWNTFRNYDKTVDKYVLRWMKDYHIYYELQQPFKEFVNQNGLNEHYPRMPDNDFDLFCAISKYDIRKSAFFKGDNIKLVADCFSFIISRIKESFIENGIHFDEALFKPSRKTVPWIPFQGSLFYKRGKQADRRIVLSENEIYICKDNNWMFGTVIAAENGRQLIGYIMKQMEAVLRKITKYKHKLSADIYSVAHEVIDQLHEAGLSLEDIVADGVMAFYREINKTVVKVDIKTLSKIREDALTIQEKLIVPEREEPILFAPPIEEEPVLLSDSWTGLKYALSEIEKKALLISLSGESDIKQLADCNGIMLEVLADGINEKAMDFVGDNLLDDEFEIYEDYIEQVKELVE